MRTRTALALIVTVTAAACVAIPTVAHATTNADLIPDSLGADHIASMRQVVAQVVPDATVGIRFDGDTACPAETLGCVTSSQPSVIHIVASAYDPASPDSIPMVAHEAAHVAVHVRGIAIPSVFEGLPPTRETPVPRGEAFADCVAAAVTGGGGGFYLSACPAELQALALDLIR